MSYTKGPWHWTIHDYSTATLSGEDDMYEHVLSSSPCNACLEYAKKEGSEWKWGRCTCPNEEDAKLIAAAPELLEALEGIIDIGKRNMENPKYDTYFKTAKEAIKKARL